MERSTTAMSMRPVTLYLLRQDVPSRWPMLNRKGQSGIPEFHSGSISSLRLEPEKYKALCKQILQRDFYKCRHCGFRGSLHVHHIIFRSQGGLDEAQNLISLCNSGHRGIHEELGLEITRDDNGEVQFIRNGSWVPK